MPTDLLGALGASSGSHPLVLVMSRDATRPIPPRTQPELSISRQFALPEGRTFDLTGNATVSVDAPDATIENALRPGDTTPAAPGVVERISAGLPVVSRRCRVRRRPRHGLADTVRPGGRAVGGGRLGAPRDARPSRRGGDRRRPPLRADAACASTSTARPASSRCRASPTRRLPNAATNVHVAFPARCSGRKIRVTIEGIREEQHAVVHHRCDTRRAGRHRGVRPSGGIGETGEHRVGRQRLPIRIWSRSTAGRFRYA